MTKVITLQVSGSAAQKMDARYLMTYAEREELIGKYEQKERENERLRESNGRAMQIAKRTLRKAEVYLWLATFFGFSAVILGMYCLILGG